MKKLPSASRPLGVINPSPDGWFAANSITIIRLSHARSLAPEFVENETFCPCVKTCCVPISQIYRPSNKTASKDNST